MELALLALAGAVLALDGTAAGQFMISRPLVAGPLAGALLGDPSVGLAVGALLEVYLLVSFPSGGARYPEGATATVVAVAAALAGEGPGALPLGIALGLLWGQLGGFTVSALRHLNGRLLPEPADGDVTRLPAAHLAALALDAARGAVLTVSGAALGRWAVPRLDSAWPWEVPESMGLLLAGGAVSLGILLRTLGGFSRRRILFAAGMALGLVGARFL